MTDVHHSPAADAPPPPADRPPLRRSRRNHVIAGVCGGLGRHFDIDPVVFRIVLGVLTVTGGVGLIFYGFAWLLVPLDGEEDNEARKLLSGRVEGGTLAALLAALVGCALFLSMLDNGGLGSFSVLVVLALSGAAYFSQRRRAAAPEGEDDGRGAEARERPRTEAPPETQAPPVPGGPSWWRDPLVKDGTTGPVGTGYLWGPEPAADGPAEGRGPVAAPRGAAPRHRGGGIGGRVFVLALLAATVSGAAVWEDHPLGFALQVAFAAALAVFGLGLTVSSVKGRTGFGTILLSVITAGLLAGATVMPRDIGTEWGRVDWRPAAVSEVRPSYEAGTGLATLDLSHLDVPRGTTLTVRASLDAGKLRVVVPREVTAKADIRVRVGDVQLPGERADRIQGVHGQSQRADLPPEAGTEPGGTIELHLLAGVGQVEVARAAS
ncbi:PspC domain-containing protein [Streptomyces antimicrobicus]|uniref:PspC domain-containing protein n=1 Tax=Streptomyces antimicrobicus TaxID=2883108 RepID=A0ABS8BAU8_9ACTN|nr:PspC domain-containing protein [Streptomyces antimicrobicus]MCB5181683.1 PspC domain-containing protein [Streptomyces antimicrobicus]